VHHFTFRFVPHCSVLEIGKTRLIIRVPELLVCPLSVTGRVGHRSKIPQWVCYCWWLWCHMECDRVEVMASAFVVQTGDLTEWGLDCEIYGLRVEYKTLFCLSVCFEGIRPVLHCHMLLLLWEFSKSDSFLPLREAKGIYWVHDLLVRARIYLYLFMHQTIKTDTAWRKKFHKFLNSAWDASEQAASRHGRFTKEGKDTDT
jgi:hypothetical protein